MEDRNVYLWKEKQKDIPYLYCIGNTGERYLFIVLKYSKYHKKYMIKSAREATEKEKKLYKPHILHMLIRLSRNLNLIYRI